LTGLFSWAGLSFFLVGVGFGLCDLGHHELGRVESRRGVATLLGAGWKVAVVVVLR